MAALLAVLTLPLCGGVFAVHVCPMEMSAAMQGHGDNDCQTPGGPGIQRQAMDCCVAPQAGSPPATSTLTLQVQASLPQPAVATNLQPIPRQSLQAQSSAHDPPPVDVLHLHSSLLL